MMDNNNNLAMFMASLALMNSVGQKQEEENPDDCFKVNYLEKVLEHIEKGDIVGFSFVDFGEILDLLVEIGDKAQEICWRNGW